MKIKKITEDNKIEFLSAFLNDHFHDHQNIPVEFYNIVYQNFPEFHYQGQAYRVVINDSKTYLPDACLSPFKSWSYSKAGISNYLDNTIMDGQYLGDDKIFFLIGDVSGVSINKIIAFLKKNDINEDFFSALEKEQEIISIETKLIKRKSIPLNKYQ